MPFRRPHHQRIARVLESLDGQLLRDKRCLFAGGTVIALRYGEYRESVDVDFLVSDLALYRDLRLALTGPQGLRAITRADRSALEQQGEVRADQYGIRTRVVVDGQPIKFEIVFESRMPLEQPGPADEVCGVPTLRPLDMAAPPAYWSAHHPLIALEAGKLAFAALTTSLRERAPSADRGS